MSCTDALGSLLGIPRCHRIKRRSISHQIHHFVTCLLALLLLRVAARDRSDVSRLAQAKTTNRRRSRVQYRQRDHRRWQMGHRLALAARRRGLAVPALASQGRFRLGVVVAAPIPPDFNPARRAENTVRCTVPELQQRLVCKGLCPIRA